jgi:hypothetical protein
VAGRAMMRWLADNTAAGAQSEHGPLRPTITTATRNHASDAAVNFVFVGKHLSLDHADFLEVA